MRNRWVVLSLITALLGAVQLRADSGGTMLVHGEATVSFCCILAQNRYWSGFASAG